MIIHIPENQLQAFIVFSCYPSIDCNPDYKILGNFIFNLIDKDYNLSKTNNTWYLTLSTSDRQIFNILSEPNYKFTIHMTSNVYGSPKQKNKNEFIKIFYYDIQKILLKEYYDLLIEMCYPCQDLNVNFNEDRFKQQFPLILNLKFDPDSKTHVLYDHWKVY